MAASPEALLDALVHQLQQQGHIRSPRVEQAFRVVQRHLFLPGVPLETAYGEEAVITHRGPDGLPRSSSSMPAIMAVMIEQLDVQVGHRVLEIGAGTGYNAALLAWLAGSSGRVTTIDLDADIVQGARDNLRRAGSDVQLVVGDGWLGFPTDAPFNRIEATVGVWDLSPHWVDQLAPGEVVVIPLWLRPGVQASIAFRKGNGDLKSVSVEPCGFMRLRGPHSGPEAYVQLHDWIVLVDQVDARKVEILGRLLSETPRREPAPDLSPGWFVRLALEEPRAISLGPKDDWRRQAAGIFDADTQALALIIDGTLETFGSDAGRGILLDRIAGRPPLDLRSLSIEAIPSEANRRTPPGSAIARPHFTYSVREGRSDSV